MNVLIMITKQLQNVKIDFEFTFSKFDPINPFDPFIFS